MLKRFFVVWMLYSLLIFVAPVFAIEKADSVRVYKNKRTLQLMKEGQVIATFRATFGADPVGHKQEQGDEKTPEGRYMLGHKNSNSSFYKSIHISYPNATDRQVASELGVSPGGDIMIHGQSPDWAWASAVSGFFNWTNGCIALSNKNMDYVWEAVDTGTPIEIFP